MAGLYGMIPAVFKAKFKTNETLLTLMFNYIATQLIVIFRIQGAGRMPQIIFQR